MDEGIKDIKMFVISADTKNFETFIPVSDDYEDTHGDILCKGETLADDWSGPLEVEVEEPDGRPVGDCSFMFAGSLVVNESAKSVFQPFLNACDELMPLKNGDADYWLLNVRNIIPAIDKTATEFNDVGLLVRKVFKNDIAVDIFKIEEDNKTYIYCSEAVVKSFDDKGITGLIFEEIPTAK
ncbi:hypothetical protein M3P05_10095 [Sansalvadorimonas sp. 2012CJ34-2]|uniref:Immunity MXAN-0049 protein domain-containing protein n=1 Tax=Parendozoicomonas callyspongiae TaxID=2942213 RepID=A0ABT0PFX3_9GAMM|nr:DUF1629 domain-containing protein [Sansalvadorimonas sp. 2012CJ34-2]MCL6270272.1 hypothetical protein [Sansalvadorimonas sp. 2012CJ34-2]